MKNKKESKKTVSKAPVVECHCRGKSLFSGKRLANLINCNSLRCALKLFKQFAIYIGTTKQNINEKAKDTKVTENCWLVVTRSQGKTVSCPSGNCWLSVAPDGWQLGDRQCWQLIADKHRFDCKTWNLQKTNKW